MKCEKCNSDYPSHYYFEVDFICTKCFKNMNDEEKHHFYETRPSKYAREKAYEYEIFGHHLNCPICKHDKFWARKTLMNTPGATFLGVEWANKQADNYICNKCGYVFWFMHE